ncbi:PREDICTED: intercellular adhesion molecule 1 [Hipposideros armiger]|uniref:Intercellular adhesion molecule 1 n=1 Tax=Hipposideros armiger TaxID=186990 RepID=A0A8B7SQF4_HIPAR|nr:PREDICTED: intercellular adhesion molecule 1 [Hipposideros armiger]
MASSAARLQLPALLAMLGALLPGPGGAQTSVHLSNDIIPRGGSVQVNCSASCDEDAVLGLETQLTKEEVNSGTNWKIYELSDIQKDSRPICFSNCHGIQTSASVSITVYSLPKRVELAPLPQWQLVGENLTLRCLVEGGVPRRHLSVLLLREEEELSRQPAVGEPAEVTTTVLVDRDNHGANFSCRTELDLRPQKQELFQNSSVPRQLRTFVLPMTHPWLVTPRIMEVGTQKLVNCTLHGLFPASEAQVHLALKDQRLEPKVTYNKDSLSAMAWVKANTEEEGTQQLTCAVILGNQSRTTRENVTIYSFPAPNLTLSQSEVSEWTMVRVECKAHARAMVTLNGAPPGPPGSSAQFLLNASAEDDGRSFLCTAALEVAGKVLHKNKTLELRVLYGPQLEESDCPGNWTWQEGSWETLKCQARGNPIPKVNCSRKGDGSVLPIGDRMLVNRNISGTYMCRATSRQVEVTHEVVVNVIYKQNDMVIIIVVAATVILGTVVIAAYLYNRQRKIREYKLQKAREAAALKLNTPP